MKKQLDDESRGEGMPPAADRAFASARKWGTRMALFLVGYGFALWAAFIPFVKMSTGLDEGGLGILLLSLGVGSVMTMPFTGGLVGRFSCRAVVVGGGLIFCLILPLLVWLDNPLALAPCIFMVGASMGAVEVAANIQGVQVQREAGRAMMSSFHAFYSVGSIAGAGFVTCCLTNGLDILFTALLGIFPVLGILLLAWRGLLGHQPRTESEGAHKSRFIAIPKGVVIILGLLLMIMYVAEGSVGNWGALLLAGFKGFAPENASLGFAVFSVTIVLGRLLGDKLTEFLGGSARMIIVSSLSSALVYFLCVQMFPGRWILPGFALLGLTMAPLAPCLFTLASKQKTMPEDLAVSAITAFGYWNDRPVYQPAHVTQHNQSVSPGRGRLYVSAVAPCACFFTNADSFFVIIPKSERESLLLSIYLRHG